MIRKNLTTPGSLNKPLSWFSKARLLWIGALGIPVFIGIIAIIVTVLTFSKSLPSFDQLESIEPRLITRLFDKNGDLAHSFYVEKRIWTPIEEIPEKVYEAIMSIEDRNFENHWGVNLWAMPGAVLEKVLRGGKLRGASTLSQQLAKNLFLTPERSLVRKIKEAMTAVVLEDTYTKQEILEFYLNQVYLGAGTYGFQAACQEYFGIPLDSISYSQAAILAGMLQRPEGLRPDRHPKRADKRRRVVLYSMKQAGYITSEDYTLAMAEPVMVNKAKGNSNVGAYFIEEVRKHMEKKHGETSLYTDGVAIHTTLDPLIQATAEQSITKKVEEMQTNLKYRYAKRLRIPGRLKLPLDTVVAHFDSLYAVFDSIYFQPEKHKPDSLRRFPDSLKYRKLQAAAIVIENETGAIRAMVGGLDFQKSKFNRAVQSVRQPGSAFKPFVYAAAMDNGAAPSDSVNDQPITIPDPMDPEKVWRPDNYGKKFSGYMTLRAALYKSKNLPAIQVGMKYGLYNLVNYARNFGLKHKLEAVPSLSIGSIGATLMEMTSAYTVFPNQGTRIEPYMIEKVQGKRGEVLESNLKEESVVLRPPAAYLMVSMMKDVNQRGTAAKIWSSGFHVPSGGKTGTTNDYTDAWYIGFTPKYTMGVWVGIDSHVPMGIGHTGGQSAAPIWVDVMKEAHKDLPTMAFRMPSGVSVATICKGTQKLSSDLCPESMSELFTYGNRPTEVFSESDLSQKTTAKQATRFSKTRDSKKPSRGRQTF